MTRLNKALQGPEGSYTGPQINEEVNESTHREHVEREIQKLKQKIEEAEAGKGKFANNSKKITEWGSFLAQKQAEFNTAKEGTTLIEEKPVEAFEVEPAQLNGVGIKLTRLNRAIAASEASRREGDPVSPSLKRLYAKRDSFMQEAGKIEGGSEVDHKELIASRISELALQASDAQLRMMKTHPSGKSSLHLINPEFEEASIDRDSAWAEIDFLEKGGTLEEWKKTPEYTEFQRRYNELKKQPKKEAHLSRADVEALIATLTNIDSDTLKDLKEKDSQFRELKAGLEEVQKHAKQKGIRKLENEIKESLVLLRSALLTIETAIAIKQRTPEAGVPTLAEVEKIASYHILEDLKGLGQDTREELARKKRVVQVIHKQLNKWVVTIGDKADDKKSAVASIKRTITDKLNDVDKILADINERDEFQKKTRNPNIPRDPEEIKAERQQDFLEQIRDGHAIYGRSIENLSMAIREDKNKIPEYAITAAEQELVDLVDLVNTRRMRNLLKERKISTDPKKRGAPYFQHYLEHIRAKTEVLLIQIKHPEQIKAGFKDETREETATTFEIDPSQLDKLKALEEVIIRFIRMCDHFEIKPKKEPAKKGGKINLTEIERTQPQDGIKVVDINEPPAPWPPDPTRAPIGKPLTTDRLEATPTPPPLPPLPPQPTSTPAVPPPLPKGLLFEEVITLPTDVPLEVQGDRGFDTWYVAISEKFKAREYLPGSVPERDLLDLYAQYNEQLPLLNKVKESLKLGELDKGLGIKTENLDKYRIDQLRQKAFEKLQYSLYEKRGVTETALYNIFEAIQKTKEYSNTIKDLEAKLGAQERILALRKNRIIDGMDAVAVVEDNKEEFIRENVAGVEAFIEDMKNNFTFYAEAAKSLKADGAQDAIYDRYAAARGRDSAKHEKIGFFGRLNTRLWDWTSRFLPKKTTQAVWDSISGQGVLKRQEEKDKFWSMVDAMKKHRLVPHQRGSKFEEGAIAQAATNINLLQQFIGIKFHNQKATMTPENEELATKMFSDVYNAHFNSKTHSVEYQRVARKQAENAKVFEKEDREEVVNLNTDITAAEDWISRALGANEPELIAETKKELFILEADAFEAKVNEIKITTKIEDLRDARDAFASLQIKWSELVADNASSDERVLKALQATEKAFAKKGHELVLMQIRQSAPNPEAVVATIVGKYIVKLQDRDLQIMSRLEKEEACKQLIREIETRLRRNDFTRVTYQIIDRAKKQAEFALTTF